MAKAPRSNAERLSSLIAELEAEAYARGRADARKELLDALTGGGAGIAGPGASRGRRRKLAASKRRSRGRKRAPRGSVRSLVERAMQGGQALAPPEILERATTDVERPIKLPSIRTELRNGRRTGKYALNDGRWSLATGSGGAEASPQAAASTGTENGDVAGPGDPIR